MRIVGVPHKVVLTPGGLVGHYVATIENEQNGKHYAFVEQWQAPWTAPAADMVGWGVWEIEAVTGNIDFNAVPDVLSEVADVVDKAGLKRRVL